MVWKTLISSRRASENWSALRIFPDVCSRYQRRFGTAQGQVRQRQQKCAGLGCKCFAWQHVPFVDYDSGTRNRRADGRTARPGARGHPARMAQYPCLANVFQTRSVHRPCYMPTSSSALPMRRAYSSIKMVWPAANLPGQVSWLAFRIPPKTRRWYCRRSRMASPISPAMKARALAIDAGRRCRGFS